MFCLLTTTIWSVIRHHKIEFHAKQFNWLGPFSSIRRAKENSRVKEKRNGKQRHHYDTKISQGKNVIGYGLVSSHLAEKSLF